MPPRALERPSSRVGIAVSGQMWRGVHYTGVVRRVDHRLRAAGHEGLYAVAGSSVGSIATVLAPREIELQDPDARDVWLAYGRRTGTEASVRHALGSLYQMAQSGLSPWRRFQREPLLPHRAVMEDLIRDLEPMDVFGKVLDSPMHLAFTATRVDAERLSESLRHLVELGILSGTRRLLPRYRPQFDQMVASSVEKVVAAGHAALTPDYFVNRWPSVDDPLVSPMPPEVFVMRNREEARRALEASIRIPGLFTPGFKGEAVVEGGPVYIDAAYSDNSPLKVLLEMGVTHAFLLTDGRNPNIYYQREFQRMALGPAARLLDLMEHMQGLRVEELRERFPGRSITVIGRHPDFPSDIGQHWGRFFQEDPRRINRAIDVAPLVADQILRTVGTAGPT